MDKNYAAASKWAMKHGWSIGFNDMMAFIKAHHDAKLNGDADKAEYIEDILEDCNFHTECRLLHDGKYGSALQNFMDYMEG